MNTTPAAPAPSGDKSRTPHIPPYFFVIDVESVGLHGEAFAVGWSVHSATGGHYEEGFFACPMGAANGSDKDREWCLKNLPEIPANRFTPRAVRDAFWPIWMLWKAEGAVMVADCGWPVEARFLAQCVEDREGRDFEGPYPLHDVASILLACGRDPMATYDRKLDELPKHHPMKDARQSGRLLTEALRPTHAPESQAQGPSELEIVDAAFAVAVFSKTHEWPAMASPEFFEFAELLDKLATAIQRRHPDFNRNVAKAMKGGAR